MLLPLVCLVVLLILALDSKSCTCRRRKWRQRLKVRPKGEQVQASCRAAIKGATCCLAGELLVACGRAKTRASGPKSWEAGWLAGKLARKVVAQSSKLMMIMRCDAMRCDSKRLHSTRLDSTRLGPAAGRVGRSLLVRAECKFAACAPPTRQAKLAGQRAISLTNWQSEFRFLADDLSSFSPVAAPQVARRRPLVCWRARATRRAPRFSFFFLVRRRRRQRRCKIFSPASGRGQRQANGERASGPQTRKRRGRSGGGARLNR